MTKQRNRPGVGVYFALILLLLCGYYLFFDITRVPGVSYAQVEDLFRRELGGEEAAYQEVMKRLLGE